MSFHTEIFYAKNKLEVLEKTKLYYEFVKGISPREISIEFLCDVKTTREGGSVAYAAFYQECHSQMKEICMAKLPLVTNELEAEVLSALIERAQTKYRASLNVCSADAAIVKIICDEEKEKLAGKK